MLRNKTENNCTSEEFLNLFSFCARINYCDKGYVIFPACIVTRNFLLQQTQDYCMMNLFMLIKWVNSSRNGLQCTPDVQALDNVSIVDNLSK